MSTSDPVHWGDRALCRQMGHPSDWDDELDGVFETPAARNLRHRRARAVCAQCPVRRRCEEDADMDHDSGIWFGLHLEAWRQAQREAKETRVRNYEILETQRWSA